MTAQVASPERQASGSSFYAAMRLLPPPERAAMFAIYGFCRQVDDIADDPGPSPDERRVAQPNRVGRCHPIAERGRSGRCANQPGNVRGGQDRRADGLAVRPLGQGHLRTGL